MRMISRADKIENTIDSEEYYMNAAEKSRKLRGSADRRLFVAGGLEQELTG
jgi:hypothetical protein